MSRKTTFAGVDTGDYVEYAEDSFAPAHDREEIDDAIYAFARQLAGLDKAIQMRAVGSVDNEGEPCEHCNLIGRTIQATLHGDRDRERITADCCIPCIPAVAASGFDAEVTVVAEILA